MRTSLPIAATALLAASLAAGCGSDDSNTSTSGLPSALTATQPAPTTTTQQAAGSHSLTVKMSEFAFEPKDAVAEAGKVELSTPNEGKSVHELVLLQTDADPAKLPKKGGKVDESTSVGEIADVEPGTTKKKTFKLKAGKYAMVCALPGHYEGGMYGSLTVR